MKVKIIADSTCDLSPGLLQKYDIAITPLSVTLGDRIGHDGTEIFPDDILDFVSSTGKMAKTSAVNINEYMDIYRHYLDEGYAIVQFCISHKMSSCYKNACTAASALENVYVIDSMNLSTGTALPVLRAAELAEQGMDAASIAKECGEMIAKVESSFVVERLDFLYKGGRCSALASFGANLLHIKPCIEVVDGQMQPGDKYRGPMNHVLEKYVGSRLSGRSDLDLSRIFITHSRCDEANVELVRKAIQVWQPGFKEVLETDAGSVVTSHCGEGTLGILFMRK